MDKNLDKIIKLAQNYKDLIEEMPYRNATYPDSVIDICEKLKALGMKWGDKINYPDFRIRKGYYITNNGTGHKSDPSEWYIEWDNGNIGVYQFISNDTYYYAVQDEFKEFKDILMAYNPLNYDPSNCHIVYDVENGKKILADYPRITKEIRRKMQIKINQVKLKKAKEEYERLLEADKIDAEKQRIIEYLDGNKEV